MSTMMRSAGRIAAVLALSTNISVFGATLTEMYDDARGPTCEYFNSTAKLSWPEAPGAYVGEKTGDRSRLSATVKFAASDHATSIAVDVSPALKALGERAAGDVNLVLFSAGGLGTLEIHSRESDDVDTRPVLDVVLASGRRFSVQARADTYLACSSRASLGGQPRILVGRNARAVLSFRLPEPSAQVVRADLKLAIRKRFGNGEFGVGLMVGFDDMASASPEQGLAARYPMDEAIESSPDVIFVERFESSRWHRSWTYWSERNDSAERVSDDDALGFRPLQGHALRVEIPARKNLGLDLRYGFADRIGVEPDEIYFRYYLRFAADWNPDVDGGKLPGISGTYGRAGWGQRRSDGTNGWSARGAFLVHPKGSKPSTSPTALGTYAYHAEMKSDYSGDLWPWGHLRAALDNNRWYSIEQFVRLNDPGRSNGVVRAWVDGVKVFEKSDLDFRHTDKLKIEQIWMNVYHGGLNVPGKDLHLYIDNVVIARRYIGPMAGIGEGGRK